MPYAITPLAHAENAAERIRQIQAAMDEERLDAVVLRLPENVLLASGWFVRYPGTALVVIPASGPGTLIVPDPEAEEAATQWSGRIAPFTFGSTNIVPVEKTLPAVLAASAKSVDATGGRIGFEGAFETSAPPSFFGESSAVSGPTKELISASFETRTLLDFSEQLEALRAIKTVHEVEMIRRSNEIACFGLEAFKAASVPGATEVEVMAAVEEAISIRGHGYREARWVRGFASVGSGPALVAGWQFFRSSTRQIARDDAVMVELGTVADGYWSDHTRTVVAGSPAPQLSEAHAAAKAAMAAAGAAALPGATGADVDAAARAACANGGFEQFPHHTGHGTGFRWHESRPTLAPRSPDVLSEGNVVAIEPGIYGSELGTGVRDEDNAVVGPNGAIFLATTAFQLGLE